MSKHSESTAVWHQVDVTSLSAEAQVAYSEYKDAQRKAAALREVFETAATDGFAVPAGQRVVFGYRFGQLSMAMVEDERKAKASKPKGTLADFFAAQSAQGRAV